MEPAATIPGEPDWVSIIQDLYDTYGEILNAPDVDRIGEVCVEGDNGCQQVQGQQVRNLVRDGQRYSAIVSPEVVSAVLGATVDGQPIDESPFVIIHITLIGADVSDVTIIDQSGEAVFDFEGQTRSEVTGLMYLARNMDDEWRMLRIER